MKNIPLRQRGATLIVALIMLGLITLLAVTAISLSSGSLQGVGNTQQRSQVYAAIQETMEEVISTTRFSDTPSAVFLQPCKGVANTKCVDINGDGTPDVTVSLSPIPACVKAQIVSNSALDLSKADDAGCAVGTGQDFGVAGTPSGDSLCADSTWEINAVGTDAVTQATVTMTQGVSTRVSTNNIPAGC